MMIKKYFAPLYILDIEDSGNNGIIFKALEYGRTRALKVFYGFGMPLEMLVKKAAAEYKISSVVSSIRGVPKTYKFYGIKSPSQEFFCAGFNKEKAKQQILANRVAYESDTEGELVLAGAFTMEFLNFFHKLPKYLSPLNYVLPEKFFTRLEEIAYKMLQKGYSLPPESDIGFDKHFNPLVVDFAGCKSIDQLSASGMSRKKAERYVREYNALKIGRLKDLYMKQW